MEVKLDKRYPVAASPERTWAVLADVRATAACMPGATITEQLDETHYRGSVKSKVGPAVMSFGGTIEVLSLDADGKSMQLLGKGADKSGSSASMNLSANIEPGETPDSSVLVGQATIVVSGKLAQFGSRLLVPVSDAMLGQFADNFRKAAMAPTAAAPLAAASTPASAPSSAAPSREPPPPVPPPSVESRVESRMASPAWSGPPRTRARTGQRTQRTRPDVDRDQELVRRRVRQALKSKLSRSIEWARRRPPRLRP